MAIADAGPIAADAKAIAIDADIGDLKPDQKGTPRRVTAITVGPDKQPRYQLDGQHNFSLVAEDAREATFQCSYCLRRVAFALPGLGEPSAVGGPGAWLPPADGMKYLDACTVEA